MQDVLDREILWLKELTRSGADPGVLDRRLALLARLRLAVCAALVNRRIEASNKVVVFARWVSGRGALGDPLALDEHLRRACALRIPG